MLVTVRSADLVKVALPRRRALRIGLEPGVHPPDPYAHRFIAKLRVGANVLDLGCGAGTYGLAAAALGARRVVLTDVDAAALRCALANGERNGLAGLEAREGSLFEPARGERFDTIVVTPPQLPAPSPVLATRYGGADGLDLFRVLARSAREHLAPGGRLYSLVTGWAGPARVAELFENGGLTVRRVARVERAFQPSEYEQYLPGLFDYLDEHARGHAEKAYRRAGAWRYLRVSFLEAHRERARNGAGA